MDGRRATTNKKSFREVMEWRPQVKWVGKARWVVDGKWWSAAGVSAGIDVTLAWVESIWGAQTARELARGMEYEWREDGSWDPFADIWGVGEVGVEGEAGKES